ncbi:MAG: FAD-binding protein, partial [Alphaproteobacteria bacterium]
MKPAASSVPARAARSTAILSCVIACIPSRQVCRARGLGFHVDGARFANAVAGSGRSPADLTWRAGVDALSFGATKNGAMAAEAVVFFDMARATTMGWRRKRAGQLWSKHRFLAAQMEAYLSGGLWLDCARQSNARAARLATGLAALPQASFLHPVEGNEIFVRLPPPVLDGLQADGFAFYRWPGEDTWLVRLVAGYDTTQDRIAVLRAALAGTLDAAGFIGPEDIGDRHRVDWKGMRGEPLAVLRPATPEAVAATMRVLHALRQPVVVQGGMTGLVHGGVPLQGEVVLSLERLNRIEDVDPVSFTATVQAGVPLETLQAAAQAHGMFFPVDIGSRGSCLVGGIVSTNAGGNRVRRYGMTRSSVLGLEVV